MAKDDPERARRLAEALRENLRKRKAQARARDDAPPVPRDFAEDEGSHAG
ncbi:MULTISPECIES: hypothetical protein [Sphingomonadales]|uniref:Uncharacterized protein n=1 Tax=Edaphosphingomonas haloaromaticamans TaxID=653954 RepID=A0A1S1HA91_9SPHN|nr:MULTISPECIES: hypothetical protein [Sphingomonas]MDX3883801.1 hypothetical protein [Sphingomonas sp.]OHT19047.1 hypothetical protein BHE75_01028 [Sphingomonas haloaromaticamans]